MAEGRRVRPMREVKTTSLPQKLQKPVTEVSVEYTIAPHCGQWNSVTSMVPSS